MIVKFEEVALLVQLVGMAVKERKDGLQLRDGIVADVHEGRLKSLYYGKRAPGIASIPAFRAICDRRVDWRRGMDWRCWPYGC